MARAVADEGKNTTRWNSHERDELAELRKKAKRLEVENEIPKRAAAYFARENVLPKQFSRWSTNSPTTDSTSLPGQLVRVRERRGDSEMTLEANSCGGSVASSPSTARAPRSCIHWPGFMGETRIPVLWLKIAGRGATRSGP